LESENKALKEKLVELTANMSSLQNNLNTVNNQPPVIRHIEVETPVVSREHESVIKDLKNRVRTG
jgi:hypothetical protein